MVNIKDKILAEDENIEKVLSELEKVKNKTHKDLVVLVGMGAFLQNIYTGMENILKQLLIDAKIQIPSGPTWHKDLLALATKNDIISKQMVEKIGKYLVFRHFFNHAYGFLIDEEKLKPLIENISDVYSEFKDEINLYLKSLKD
jgi:uncharacterized protein YutE (UPF0331/DUF86 family)